MFRYMVDVILWAMFLSFVMMGLAFMSEGRGLHLLRVLLGLSARKQGLDAFETVPRDEGEWLVVGGLDENVRMPRTTAARAQQPAAPAQRAVRASQAIQRPLRPLSAGAKARTGASV